MATSVWTSIGELRATGSQKALILLERVPDLAVTGAQVAEWIEEDWPEALAWIMVASGPVYLLRLVIRRPRICLAVVSLWSSWLGVQVLSHGVAVLEKTQMRGLTAMKATREVVQKSVVAVEAWIVVFLPFVADMWRKGRALWHVLSFRTKVVLVAGPVGLYLFCLAVKRLLDAFHRNRAAMKRTLWAVLFHGSFLLACPVLWYVSGCISPKWQHLCLKHFLTTVPTLGSLFALGWRPAPQIAELLALEAPNQHLALTENQASVATRSAGSRRASERPTRREEPMEFQASASTQRFWLSYWATWPVLVVAEQGLPYLLELLDVPEVEMAQANLRRTLLIFVIWLQLWQGSRLQLSLLRHVAGKLPSTWPSLGDLPFFEWMQFLRGGLSGTPSLNVFSLLQSMLRQRWRLLASGVAGVILLGLLVTAFYRAVSFANRLLVMLLWVFAACDSADTLAHGHESMLPRKLSFWAVAMLWTWLSQVPVLGAILRLFTPIVFALLMAAGETILKRAVQPMLDLAMKPLLRVLLYLLRRMSRAARVVCSPLRLLRLLLMAVQSVASRQADVAEAETVEESLALPEASPTLPSASAAAEASSSATVPTPPVPAASPTESRRSSTTSVNGAGAATTATERSPEVRNGHLRQRKKGKRR